ncbi:ATP-grasp domain-containing protein [Micromonospora sp. URMC 103]|uniref:ATP-grasp domain-containing protein n=1 Tax=Micromonospora sp. URMC 103 TaxID=3423406 RepID=UPI003F1B581E
MKGDLLVLSKWNSGGVRRSAEAARRLGYRPILVSADPEDLNRDSCHRHVVFDWEDGSVDDLAALLARIEVRPLAVLNRVEALGEWQVRISRYFGLPGGEAGRDVLLSKVRVRQVMSKLGLGTVRHVGGRAGDASLVSSVDFYPAIVKPSRQSGASRLVKLVRDPEALAAQLHRIATVDGPLAEVVIESYVEGLEFSIDGPVVDGRLRPLFVCDKPDYDYDRQQEGGVLVSPPDDERVRAGVQPLVEQVSTLCASLDIGPVWLHVEGRRTSDGRVELIEINPRCGGGATALGIKHVHGLDVGEVLTRMALPEGWPPPHGLLGGDAWAHHQRVAQLPVGAGRLGLVIPQVSAAEIARIDGVLDAIVLDWLEVTSLERENYFAHVLLAAPDTPALRALANRVRSALSTTVIEEAESKAPGLRDDGGWQSPKPPSPGPADHAAHPG